jgi:N-acetylglucosamine-6-phosphate deacetylase
MQAFANGLSVSTHTGNVMSGIHHRNMGGLGAAC